MITIEGILHSSALREANILRRLGYASKILRDSKAAPRDPKSQEEMALLEQINKRAQELEETIGTALKDVGLRPN
jgi:hypothetical protein